MTAPIKSPCEGSATSSLLASKPTQHSGTILVATILASSMAFIDGTVVNVALPALQSALHANVMDMQWVVESYALLLASLLLLSGSLGDLYGRRKIFLGGVLLFTLASIWCGLSPTIGSLVFARAVQGIGAAFLIPGSLAIISASFSETERGRAIGTWSGFTAITAAIGPVLGGWLVTNVSWRWVFFINIPIAIVVVGLTLWRVPESRNESASHHLDWQGAFLATFGLGAVTFALIQAPGGGLAIWICGIGGVLALVAFFFVESRSPAPMMSLRLFRSRDFSGANLLTFLLYASLSGILFFLPMNLIQVQHYSATQAGAALLPLILLIFILSRWAGGLVARFGARLPLAVGSIFVALGYAFFLLPGIGGSYWTTFFPAVILLGIGMAICVAPLTTAVMESVPPTDVGVASGVNNAVSRIAGLLAIALFGLALSAGFNRSLDRSLAHLQLSDAARQTVDVDRPKLAGAQNADPRIAETIDRAFVSGFRLITAISAGLALLSALCAYQMIGARKPTAGADH